MEYSEGRLEGEEEEEDERVRSGWKRSEVSGGGFRREGKWEE